MNTDKILFRARSADKTARWIEGYFILEGGDYNHIVNKEGKHKVIAGSKEQWTGLWGLNGNKIWTGSIVAVPFIDPMGNVHTEEGNSIDETVVKFQKGEFVLASYKHQPVPESLIEWRKREEGDYIPNYGKKTIWKKETYLRVIGNTWERASQGSDDYDG